MSLFPHRFVVFCLALISSGPLFPTLAGAQDICAAWSSTAVGADAMWNIGANWSTSPDFPNNSETQSYAVSVNSGLVFLNQDITVNRLSLGEQYYGIVEVPAGNLALIVQSGFTVNKGLLTRISTSVHGTLTCLGDSDIAGPLYVWGWQVRFLGNTSWRGNATIGNGGMIDNYAGATLSFGEGAAINHYPPDSSNPDTGRRSLNNEGTIRVAAPGGSVVLDLSINNYGTIDVQSGSLILKDGGLSNGVMTISDGTAVDFEPTTVPLVHGYVFGPTSSTSGAGSITFNSGENFSINGDFNLTGTTTIASGTVTFYKPITNLGSELIITGQFTALDLGPNSASVERLTLKSGTITGMDTLEVTGLLEWNHGRMIGTGITNARSGVLFNGLNSATASDMLNRTLNCFGASRVETGGQLYATLYFDTGAALNIMPGASLLGGGLYILGSDISDQTWGSIRNYGRWIVDDSGSTPYMSVYGTAVTNDGRIEVTNATLDLRTTGFFPGLVQDSGDIVLKNGSIGEFLQLNGGSLAGFGNVGTVINNGLIAPDGGDLNFNQQSLTLLPDSVLAYQVTVGQRTNSAGRIVNVSKASLAGKLTVTMNGSPTKRNVPKSITVLSASAVIGQFSNAGNGDRLTSEDGTVSFVVTYSGNAVTLSHFKPNRFKRGR